MTETSVHTVYIQHWMLGFSNKKMVLSLTVLMIIGEKGIQLDCIASKKIDITRLAGFIAYIHFGILASILLKITCSVVVSGN